MPSLRFFKEQVLNWMKSIPMKCIMPSCKTWHIPPTIMVKARKRSEQELIRSHEVLKTILERSPFGVAVIGRDRKIRWVNHYVSALAGMEDATELVDKECGEYLCPASQNECPILDRHQEVDNTECILRRQDGRGNSDPQNRYGNRNER